MQKLPPFLYALRGGNSRKFSFSTFSTRKELLGGKLSQNCMFSKLLRGGNARKFLGSASCRSPIGTSRFGKEVPPNFQISWLRLMPPTELLAEYYFRMD